MDSELISQWLNANERNVSWLARKLGRSPQCVHKWMKTRWDIPASVALRISEITGLDVRKICPPPPAAS
jgi:DNA-binding transcriptional regulator YdaS (Cro superfamily)